MRHTSLPHATPAVQEAIWRRLAQQARRVMEVGINRMMEMERELLLGCRPYERTGVRRGYRNGFATRRFDSRWGPLTLQVPKVRDTAQPFRSMVLRRYRRRQAELEHCVTQWVASGMSTRAVCHAMSRAFGAILSPTTVSRIVAEMDRQLEAFRSRPFRRGFRYVYLDGKHGKMWTQRRGRRRRRVRKAVLLLAWGIGHDGREALIDFQVAPDESEASWDAFLRRLRARGVVERNPWEEPLERILSDGGGGLAAALALNYPDTPQQVCVFHKIQNLADHLMQRTHRGRLQAEAGAVFDAPNRAVALRRLRRWRTRWEPIEPEAVGQFVRDLDRMLLFYEVPVRWRRRLKTTNPLERFIRELNRKFRQVGIFANAQSWERLTYVLYRELVHRGYGPFRKQPEFTPDS